MTDRYVPIGYAPPPSVPRRQSFLQPQQSPRLALAPLPPQEAPLSYTPLPVAYQPQPLPYDPNASPTEPWDLAPSNAITPLDPNRGKSLDEITPQRAWRGW